MAEEHTLEHYFSLMSPSGVTSDPKGELVSVTLSRTYHEKKQPTETSILVYSVRSGELLHRFEEKNHQMVMASLNSTGKKLAFTDKDSEKYHLVINDLEQNTSEKLALDGKPHQIQWHGDKIIVLMDEKEDPEIKARKEEGADGYFFEEDPRYSSVFIYTPGSGFKKLTEALQVWEFSASNERVALVASERPTESSWYHSKLYSLDLEGNSISKLYDPGWRSIARPRISGDGKKVLFTECLWSDRGLTTGDLVLYDYTSGKVKNVTDGDTRSYSDSLWLDSSAFAALWNSEGISGITEFHDSPEDVWHADGTVLSGFAPEFTFSNGKYYFAFTDASTPAELFSLERGSGPEKVSSFNEQLSSLRKYPSETVKWKSSDGLEIYGVLRSLGKDAPLVVNVHGGPTSASVVSFLDRTTLLLGQGYSVFLPNYRGSTGKGRKYAEANRGDMGGMDYQDIIAGIEYLKNTGRVTTDNIFITGGSYGGFMTSWAVTQTDVFKAAVGLFGITDWQSFHGVSSLSDWDQLHYDDDPYAGNLYTKFSPMNHIKNVRTPTLLMHGIEDPYVPVGQYYQFYRGLRDLGKTTRFLLFPREGHGFSEKKHVEQYTKETVEWFRKYTD